MRTRSIHWPLVSLLLLALIAALPLWAGPGLINTRGGGDSPFLFFRLHQLSANLQQGLFPARWMPDAAYGLGYPFFNYYAALPYYLGAVFNLLGLDLLSAIKLTQTLGMLGAALAMYGWARRFTPTRSVRWLIAAAYTFAPFHLVNLYVRGDSLSEFYAFLFYPLILWSIDRVLESPRALGWLALSYGGLIVTHNVSALIFSPFVVGYALLRGASARVTRQTWAALIGGLLLSFALSAWFWLPALGEAHLVQLDNQTTGYFNYAEHFRSTDLVQSSIGFSYAIEVDPGSGSPFSMGLVQAAFTLLGALGLIGTWRRAADKPLRLFVLLGLGVSTLMITPLSKVLWDTLPLLPLTQFPWRFLSVQAVFSAVTIGLACAAWPDSARARWAQSAIGLGLAAVMLIALRPEYLPVRAAEITPDRLQLYETFTGNIGTTIRAEYLPRTTLPRPYSSELQLWREPSPQLSAIVSGGAAQVRLLTRQSASQTWAAVVTSDTATINVPILYWPGWEAWIDGQPVAVRAAPDLGYLQLDVPRGDHTLNFSLGRTPLRALAESVSLIALAVTVVWAVWANRSRPRVPWAAIAINGGLIAVIAAASGLLVSGRADVAADAPLSMDFDQRPWLHHNVGGLDFGAMQVLSYTLAYSPAVGVDVDLMVQAAAPVTGTVEVVAPSTPVLGGPRPVLAQSRVFTPGLNSLRLSEPLFALPTGLLYVRVQAGGHVEYLRPFWNVPSDPGLVLHPFGKLTPEIGLGGVLMQHLEPDTLEVALTWTISGVSAANYGVALRLHDAAGKVWTSLDTQPGYGFLPTSAWRPGVLHDGYALHLPPDMPRDQAYQLDVILYRVAAQQEAGRTTIDGLRADVAFPWRVLHPPHKTFGEPEVAQRVDAIFADQIRLAGYTLTQTSTTLELTLGWQALRDIDRNYKVFVHLFDPATETIVAQSDAMPRANTYATSRWFQNEAISDTLVLPLANVPPGAYRLAIGLFDETGRLPVSGRVNVEDRQRRVVLSDTLRVP